MQDLNKKKKKKNSYILLRPNTIKFREKVAFREAWLVVHMGEEPRYLHLKMSADLAPDNCPGKRVGDQV